MSTLAAGTLHAALADPVLASIGFLNEVRSRYPEAISFGPGAPNPAVIDAFDPGPYVERFCDHLRHHRGLDQVAAHRLLLDYGPSGGLINDLVAASLRIDEGVNVAPEAVVVTVGAQEALFLTLRALFRCRGDRLAVADPSFPGVVGAARLLDLDVIPVRETATGLDLDHLRAVCAAARADGDRVRACYVAPDFANPGGVRMTLAARQELLRLAEDEDLVLIEDNTYGFTADPGAELPSLKALDGSGQVVHVGTFAKIAVPGLRVGFAVADQRLAGAADGRRLLAEELATVKSMVTVNTPPLCQAVAGGLLLTHGGSLRRLGAPKGRLYRANLRLLLDELDRHLAPAGRRTPGITWNRPEGGFFLRLRLPIRVDAALLELSAARYGVLWTPMSAFHLGDSGDFSLRLSCSSLDAAGIRAGVARLATFLQEQT